MIYLIKISIKKNYKIKWFQKNNLKIKYFQKIKINNFFQTIKKIFIVKIHKFNIKLIVKAKYN